MELNSEIAEKINDLIGLERIQLSKENTNELIVKLKNKINSLKDNFIVNLPHQYNDEVEFLKLCTKIANLKERLNGLKKEDEKIRNLVESLKSSRQTANEFETSSSQKVEAQLKVLILKSICVRRHLCYIKCLIKVDEYNLNLEKNFKNFEDLKEKKNTILNQESRSTPKKNATSLQNAGHNAQIQSVLSEFDQSINDIVISYQDLIEYSSKIINTKCENLKGYILDLVNYWNERIKLVLVNEAENQLKNLSYPFNESVKTSIAEQMQQQHLSDKTDAQIVQANKDKLESLFKISAMRLLKIEFSTFNLIPSSKSISTSTNERNSRISIISLLVQPLEKRFKFHFFTNRKTNNLEKPEWYFSQVLQWIKDQDKFINRFIQPIFESNEYLRNDSALIKFSNGLLNLVKEKVEFDLHNLLKNQSQFSHTINELLLFDSQLKTYLQSNEVSLKNFHMYTCLHFICENPLLFSHWLNLERQVCQKKLDLIFSYLSPINAQESQEADKSISHILSGSDAGQNVEKLNEIWSCDYSDVDNMKPPHCAESFILMLKTMKDRFSDLPYPSKRLRFVNLQLELINDFHLQLCQISRDEVKTPFSKSYLGSLNTINYIIYVLDEWKNSTFYIETQYFKVKYEQFLKKVDINNEHKMGTSDSIESLNNEYDDNLCKIFDENIMYLDMKKTPNSLNLLFEIEGTLFDEVLPSYEKVKEDMIITLTNTCKWEITSRSKFYKKEKWMAMPLFSEYYKPTLTQSAADMLISLKNLLNLLKDSIAKTVFESIVKKLTIELDKFFFNDIIAPNKFNEGGVLQLDFDIQKYLMSILNQFACDIKIENYFRMTKEALILLKLKQGSAILLKEIVLKAFSQENEYGHGQFSSEENTKLALYNAKNALKEFGIVQLDARQAIEVLSLRSDFSE